MTVKYIDDIVTITPDMIILRPLPWQERGLMATSTGYGKKIPTRKMLKINNRLHRIYCCIFSNSGSCYITYNKQTYYLRYDNY